MPNHVTNILTVHGPEDRVKKLFGEISSPSRMEQSKFDKSKLEEIPARAIDFEKIIPMPKTLNVTSDGLVHYLDNMFANKDLAIRYFVDQLASRAATPEAIFIELKKAIEEYKVHQEKLKAKAEMDSLVRLLDRASSEYTDDDTLLNFATAVFNKKEYGSGSWYDWSRKSWGTKWNAYSIKVTAPNEVVFDTAWSCPAPIFEALSERYPDLLIEVHYADEDTGSNCGHFYLKGGDADDVPESPYEDLSEYSDYSRTFAQRVHGDKDVEIIERENESHDWEETFRLKEYCPKFDRDASRERLLRELPKSPKELRALLIDKMPSDRLKNWFQHISFEGESVDERLLDKAVECLSYVEEEEHYERELQPFEHLRKPYDPKPTKRRLKKLPYLHLKTHRPDHLALLPPPAEES